jgi:DNA polymerase-1
MDYRRVTTLKEIQDYLGASNLIAFDFETAPLDEYHHDDKAALDAHKAVIVGVSLSVSEGTGIYVPLRHRTGGNADSPEKIMDWLSKAVFTNSAIIKAAHNLSFEAMFLYALGIVVQPPCYDTIAAAQMTLKNNTEFRSLGDSGLKALVPELFDVDLPSFEAVTDGRYFDELDPRDTETIRYACADSDYTLRLYHLFNNWFDRYLPKHRYVVEEIESPTAVYVGLMKYNGLLVDRELMLKKQAEAEAKLAELKNEIAFMIGDVEIGANASTAAFKKYLYEDLKLPVLKTTAKYQEAADDETMILLSDWSRENRPELARLFELVQEYRKWGKIKSTYIDGYLQQGFEPHSF